MSFKEDPNNSSKMVPVVSREVGGSGNNPIVKAISVADGASTSESRSVWVGTGGDITFTLSDGNTADFRNIDDGTLLPIRVTSWTALDGAPTNVLFLY